MDAEMQPGDHVVATKEIRHERGGRLLSIIRPGTRGIIDGELGQHVRGRWWVLFEGERAEYVGNDRMKPVSPLILLAELA